MKKFFIALPFILLITIVSSNLAIASPNQHAAQAMPNSQTQGKTTPSHRLAFTVQGNTSNPGAIQVAANSNPSALANLAKQPTLIPSPPSIDAKGFILEDVHSGKVLAEKNADERMSPASLTKLMTLYLTFDALSRGQIQLDSKVRVSVKAWRMGGSKMFIRAGNKVTVNDLIRGIIVDSGNDACIAMAEYIAGSENAFVNLMNQQANLLGMTNTHYTDATGMPHPNHYSSPRDIAKLARAIILTFPQYYSYFSEKSFTYNKIKQHNRNRLLWRSIDADGMKTGHTSQAGYCLVASAKQDDTRLLSVVMGTPSDNSRTDDSQALLTYGFRFFESHKLYSAGKAIDEARVWKGAAKNIPVGLAHDMVVTIPKGQYNNLKATMLLDKIITAPVKQGQTLGKVDITLDSKEVAQQPLLALQASPKGSIWRRMSDAVSLSIHKFLAKKPEA